MNRTVKTPANGQARTLNLTAVDGASNSVAATGMGDVNYVPRMRLLKS